MPFLPFSKSAGAPKDAEHWCRAIARRLLLIGSALCISGLLVAAVSGFGLYLRTKVPSEPTEADKYLVGYFVGGLLVLVIGASTVETGWRFRKAGKADARDSERLVAALRALSGTLGWLIPFCVLPLFVGFAILLMTVIMLLQRAA
jgi:hypothetical protein